MHRGLGVDVMRHGGLGNGEWIAAPEQQRARRRQSCGGCARLWRSSVVHVARRAPTAVVAAKGFNVQILVEENEGEESIFRLFRREVMRAGVLQEIKRRRRYESNKDEKKRKQREAGRRNRRRRMMDEPRFPEEDAGAARGRDEDDDNWEIAGIL